MAHNVIVEHIHRMRRGKQKGPDAQQRDQEQHPSLLRDEAVKRQQRTDKRSKTQSPFPLAELLGSELLITLLHHTPLLKRYLALARICHARVLPIPCDLHRGTHPST